MISRGVGPWPTQNNELEVKKWLISRISQGVEEDERASVVNLCLDYLTNKTKGERIANDYRYTEALIDKLALYADQINSNIPVQYVLGITQFNNLEIIVEDGVLIPRPETEELVAAINSEIGTGFNGSIVDIGTGSGCIALSLKYLNPQAHVVGLDISSDAIEIAKRNCQNLGLGVEFIQSDIFEDQIDEVFDVVVSNPPYILRSERKSLEKRVKDFEPDIALFVDEDPLLFYRRILFLCRNGLLNSGGLLALECHKDYTSEIADLLDSDSCFNKSQIITDLQGEQRHVIAINKVN